MKMKNWKKKKTNIRFRFLFRMFIWIRKTYGIDRTEELNQHTEGLVNEEMQHVAHHEQEVQHQHNEHLEGEQTVLIKSEQDAEHLQQVMWPNPQTDQL